MTSRTIKCVNELRNIIRLKMAEVEFRPFKNFKGEDFELSLGPNNCIYRSDRTSNSQYL